MLAKAIANHIQNFELYRSENNKLELNDIFLYRMAGFSLLLKPDGYAMSPV